MASNDRLLTRGAKRARKIRAELASGFREARLHAGISQEEAGRRAGLSADKVWKMEHEALETLSFEDACRLAAVLGLDVSVRTYPNGAPIRDAGQASRLMKLLGHVAKPLHCRTDVPLPRLGEALDLRAWDALITGSSERTAIELESRLTDLQATTRRHNLKRRDDPVDHFLLVIADTRHNRRVVAEYADLLADLPRLSTAAVIDLLAAGKHSPTGWMLL